MLILLGRQGKKVSVFGYDAVTKGAAIAVNDKPGGDTRH